MTTKGCNGSFGSRRAPQATPLGTWTQPRRAPVDQVEVTLPLPRGLQACRPGRGCLGGEELVQEVNEGPVRPEVLGDDLATLNLALRAGPPAAAVLGRHRNDGTP